MHSVRATSKMKRRSIAPISESGSSQSFLVSTPNAGVVCFPFEIDRATDRSLATSAECSKASDSSIELNLRQFLITTTGYGAGNAGICEIKLANDRPGASRRNLKLRLFQTWNAA